MCFFTLANAAPSTCAPRSSNVSTASSTPLYGKQSQTGRSCATWLETNCVVSDKHSICGTKNKKKIIHISFFRCLHQTVCTMSPEQLFHCLAERRAQTCKYKLSRALEGGFTQHTLN